MNDKQKLTIAQRTNAQRVILGWIDDCDIAIKDNILKVVNLSPPSYNLKAEREERIYRW